MSDNGRSRSKNGHTHTLSTIQSSTFDAITFIFHKEVSVACLHVDNTIVNNSHMRLAIALGSVEC